MWHSTLWCLKHLSGFLWSWWDIILWAWPSLSTGSVYSKGSHSVNPTPPEVYATSWIDLFKAVPITCLLLRKSLTGLELSESRSDRGAWRPHSPSGYLHCGKAHSMAGSPLHPHSGPSHVFNSACCFTGGHVVSIGGWVWKIGARIYHRISTSILWFSTHRKTRGKNAIKLWLPVCFDI